MHGPACPRGLEEGRSRGITLRSMVGCLDRVGLSFTRGDSLVPILFFFSHLAPTLNFPVQLLPLLHSPGPAAAPQAGF